ncbi:ribonuclease H-like domain-containing protein, partial [Tanacetum coccineum]
DVYMTLPDGYNDKNKSKVCKLNKSLYGLKQAPRQWNVKLTTALAKHGFDQSKFNYSLYTKQNGDKFIALLVYVDDIVITGNDDAARPTDIPLLENSVLSFDETTNDKYLSDFTSYQKLVGKLIYLTNTRPDISYAIHCLSQHMHSPLQFHFKASLRVLRYLKGSPGCGIQFYKNFVLKIKAYADADWAKCPKTRNLKHCLAESCEVVWLGNLLHSIGKGHLVSLLISTKDFQAIYRVHAVALFSIIF